MGVGEGVTFTLGIFVGAGVTSSRPASGSGVGVRSGFQPSPGVGDGDGDGVRFSGSPSHRAVFAPSKPKSALPSAHAARPSTRMGSPSTMAY